MKKGQKKLLIFSILFILSALTFVSVHFISATTNYDAIVSAGYYCNVVAKSNCVADSNGNPGYIIMGLSALTNAHGESSTSSTTGYPDAICCHFPGNNLCTPSLSNKILGLYMVTNAHAEIPSNNNYPVSVCYQGVQCTSLTACNDAYPINISSLVATTNSHIGAPLDYANKICCQLTTLPGLGCTLTVAAFSTQTATQGGIVQLAVNGTNCPGMTINLTATDTSNNLASTQPQSISFPQSTTDPNGVYSAVQNWQTPLGTSATYKFNATVYLGTISLATINSGNNLVVSSGSSKICTSVCDQYQTSTDCSQDSCGAALATYNANGPYDPVSSPAPTNYLCSWSSTTNSCLYNATYSYASCQPQITSTGWSDCTSGVQTQAYYDANSCAGFSLPSQVCNTAGNECNIAYNGQTLPTKRLCPYSTTNCGNGFIDAGEQCDGSNFGNLQCSSFDGFSGGSLSCTNSCQTIDTSQCTGGITGGSCGNGIVDSGEICDGTNFTQSNGIALTCASQAGQGYTGSLSCSSSCKAISISNCAPPSPSGCNINDNSRTNWNCGSWTLCSGGQQSRTCICGSTTQTDSQVCSGSPINYCGVGTTLCYDSTSLTYLCLPYACSASGDPHVGVPDSNGNKACSYGEGCGSQDCLNYKGSDTCVSSLGTALCNSISNLCANPGGTTTISGGINLPCGQGQTQCSYNGVTQCYTGSSCPAGTQPTSSSCSSSGTSNGGSSSSCLSGFVCTKTGTGNNGYCSSPNVPIGSCSITSSVANGNACQNGFITYNIVARWSGTSTAPASCQSGTKTIECPAQIPLPFFTVYNAIITIVILALIYIIIIWARKKSLKQKPKNTRNNRNSRRRKH